MTELTLKIVIILIPGALATIVFGKLILHKEWSYFRFLLYATLFGCFSYLLLQFFISIINFIFITKLPDLSIWKSLAKADIIPYKEVFYSSIVALLLAFFISYIENNKWINKMGRALNISNKYGEENLFSRFLNDSKIDWVYLRDIKNNLTYHGCVRSFSETDTLSEIKLGEVSIYSYKKSELLYEVDEVYLSFSKSDIIIEKAIVKTIKDKNNGKE